jgi:Major Facilitator Superfamily
MAEQVVTGAGDARSFEWWMTSNLALGLAFNCFLPVLLPSYVLSTGGTATDVWVAMSMAGLFALLGPSIGQLARRHRAHRLVQVLGMLGMAIGLVALALSHGDSLSTVLAIAVMGTGAAAVAVAAPIFILASDLPADFQARQLTWLQLNLDFGKVVGGLLLGAMATEKLSFPAQFLLGGLVLGLLGMLVWTTSRCAASRIRQPEVEHTAPSKQSRTVVPWRTLLLSLFGVPVLAQLLGSMTMMDLNHTDSVRVGRHRFVLPRRSLDAPVQPWPGVGHRPRPEGHRGHRPGCAGSRAWSALPRRVGRVPGVGVDSRHRLATSDPGGSPGRSPGERSGHWSGGSLSTYRADRTARPAGKPSHRVRRRPGFRVAEPSAGATDLDRVAASAGASSCSRAGPRPVSDVLTRYMRSGAAMPSRSRPCRSVWAARWHSAIRLTRTGWSAESTGQAS